VSNNIQSSVSQISESRVNSALAGGVLGTVIGGKKGGLLGATLGSVLGGGGLDELKTSIDKKLSGIIGGAEELLGIAENPIRILQKGEAELLGLAGDYLGQCTADYEELSARSFFEDFIDAGYKTPYKNAGKSASRIPNPLRNHNGYNYIITLGILDANEYNNPESYRSAGGFKNIIFKSGGGNLDKKYQVFDERAGGSSEHAEYYIEDLDIDATISPNPNTGLTAGSFLSFTVIEPYSMGNFVEAITGACIEAGYRNYLDAPFCLKIDFVGWNEGGQKYANFLTRPIFIPVKFVTVEFNVTGQGSTYSVTATPMSETGLSDKINQIKTPIKSTGTFVHEVLETSASSLTTGINAQIQALEEAGALAPFDRFVVAFPKTRTELVDALKQNFVDESSFINDIDEELRIQKGANNLSGETYRAAEKANNVAIVPANPVYAVIKSFAENTDSMNEIGKSAITIDSNQGGNTAEAEPAAAINPETNKVDASSQAAQTADKARDYQFAQGEQITKAIEKIVMQSEYAAEKATEEGRNGTRRYFKIDTQVFYEENAEAERQMGRPPKVYVYSVVPYEFDEAVVLGTEQTPTNTQGLKKAAAKEYNYIYTGKNEDVLNFDIKFDQAFQQTALAGFGQNRGPAQNSDNHKTNSAINNVETGAAPPPATDISQKTEAGPEITQAASLGTSAGYQGADIRRSIAETFHDRIINMPLDMVTAEMEIVGDPYWLPQETGNYVARRADRPGVTDDGTMTYQQSQVMCVINFKTPFDYQIKGATMEFPQVVPGFSGLYAVWAVTCRFSKGQFTQTLKMQRRRGQDDPPTTGNKAFVEVNAEATVKDRPVDSKGVVGSGSSNQTQAGAVNSIMSSGALGFDDIKTLLPALEDLPPINLPNIEFPDIKLSIPGVDFGVGTLPDLKTITTNLNAGLADAQAALQNAAGDFQNAANAAQSQIQQVSKDVDSQISNLSNKASAAINQALSGPF
jgi:hypothetical protein